MQTNHGAIEIELSQPMRQRPSRTPKLARTLLQGRHLPPRDPGLLIQGGDPTGHRLGRPRIHIRGRVQPNKVVPGRPGHGELRAEHERLAVFIVTADACSWLDGKHTVFGPGHLGNGRRRRDLSVATGRATGRGTTSASSR